MNGLLRLPNELILEIIPHLDPLSKHHLSCTNKALHCLVGPVELDRQAIWTLRLEREQSDPDRYHRLCSSCLRLCPFWNYSRAHAGPKTKALKRKCLDCLERGLCDGSNPQVIVWFFGIRITPCFSCGRLVRRAFLNHPLNHTCYPRGLRLEDLPTTDGEEPLVCHLRARLDRLETILPPKYLLRCRSVTQSNFETLLSSLESFHKERSHECLGVSSYNRECARSWSYDAMLVFLYPRYIYT
jgi:hypothetical protein